MSRLRFLGTCAALAALTGLVLAAPAPAAIPLEATAVGAGGAQSCAVSGPGEALCWGRNTAGAVGDGSTEQRLVATPVHGLDAAIAVSTGRNHTCAIRAGGQAVCWGENESGQLGDGTTGARLVPAPVSGLGDAIAISAGSSHSCAIRAGGQAVCWGGNEYGELGYGGTEWRLAPTPVAGLGDAIAISAGKEHSCAIRAGGQAVCWGDQGFTVFSEDTSDQSLVPVAVGGLGDAVAISAGSANTCAIRAGGQALCWGSNFAGQLGDGSTERRSLPTPVSGLGDATAISVGSLHSCAIRAGGQALCWGDNDLGQLGDGAESVQSLVPSAVSGLADAVAISAGGLHSCAIRAGGGAVCWGANGSGYLGDGKVGTLSRVPVRVLAAAGPWPAAVADPRLGVRVVVAVVSGRVRVRRPGSAGFSRLKETESAPVGSLLDTRKGRVRIYSATDNDAGIRSAEFHGGRFTVAQAKRPGAVTEVRLAGRLHCPGGAAGAVRTLAAKPARGRLVWGDGGAGHRSSGRNSAASVRGTRWLVWDRCDGTTLTRVAEGTVRVRDFVAGRTVTVRRGGSYVAGR